MATSPSRKIFIAHAEADEEYKKALETHLSTLKRQQLIETWDAQAILPGTDRFASMHDELAHADIVLLLSSSDFSASEEVWRHQLERSMERHHRKEAVVIPVLLRPHDWQSLPYGTLQPLPSNGTPVTSWPDADAAYLDIAKGIKRVLESMHKPQAKGLPKIDFNRLDYTHALRPAFTEKVLRTLLQRRQSINLIAERGCGGNRLLEDLRHCQIPDTQLIEVNMKNYVASYAGFLQDIAMQMDIPVGSHERIASYLTEAAAHTGKQLLLGLRNFDTLLNDPADLDARYDVAFLNELNALRNKPDIRLLYETQRPHNQCQFRGRTSWLSLELISLPELSDNQIEKELQRHTDLPASLLIYLVEQIETEARPYAVLQRLLPQLSNGKAPDKPWLKQQLKDIRKALYNYGR